MDAVPGNERRRIEVSWRIRVNLMSSVLQEREQIAAWRIHVGTEAMNPSVSPGL